MDKLDSIATGCGVFVFSLMALCSLMVICNYVGNLY